MRLSLKALLSLRSPGLAGRWRSRGSVSDTGARRLCPSEGPHAGPPAMGGGCAGCRPGGFCLHRSLLAALTCPGHQPRALSDGPRAQAFCCSAGACLGSEALPSLALGSSTQASWASGTAVQGVSAFLLKPQGYEQVGSHFPNQEASVYGSYDPAPLGMRPGSLRPGSRAGLSRPGPTRGGG